MPYIRSGFVNFVTGQQELALVAGGRCAGTKGMNICRNVCSVLALPLLRALRA